MNKNDSHLRVETKALEQMGRELGAHFVGCLLHLVAEAEDNGEIAYETAVKLLAAAPGMNDRKAQNDVGKLVKAKWLVQKGEQLAIKGYGTAFL